MSERSDRFKYKVDVLDANMRLDLYIYTKEIYKSRSHVVKSINNSEVQVNNKIITKPSYKVRVGDVIEIISKLDDEKHSDVNFSNINYKLKIVYEDKDIIIVNKPAGLVVHAGQGHENDTLVDILVDYNSKLKLVGDKRGGLIHRLDKDTSGIIGVAKTNDALWYYSKLFADRKVLKEYRAICSQAKYSLANRRFTVTGTLKRVGDRKRFGLAKGMEEGKYSETKFEVIRSFDRGTKKYYYMSAYPKTGRTHQIRVHLKSQGMPIVGDRTYNGEKYDYMLLHAYKLQLVMMSGEEKSFRVDVPEYFNKFMKNEI